MASDWTTASSITTALTKTTMAAHADYGSFPSAAASFRVSEAADDSSSPCSGGHTYPHARETSLVSRVFFLWFAPLVEIAGRRRVRASDIWDLPVHARSQRAYEEFLVVYKTHGSLLWSLARCHWKRLLGSGVLAFGGVVFSVAHPLLLYAVVRIATSAGHREDVAVIMLLLGAILVANTASMVFKRHSLRVVLIVSTKAVGAIETLLFDHAATAATPTTTSVELSTAPTATASGTDASFLFHELGKVYHVLSIIHTPWVYSLHVSANLFMLYSIIGDAFVVSILSAIVAQIVALALTSLDTISTHKWTQARAQRIQVVSECVKTMQTIKLHAWQNRFLDRITALRTTEVAVSLHHLAFAVVTRSILAVLPEIIMIFTFAGLTSSDEGLTEFDPASVFATVAIVYRLHSTFTMFITHVADLVHAYLFLKQLDVILQQRREQQERSTKRRERSCTPPLTPLVQHPQVMIHVAHAMIAQTLDEPILISADLLVRRGELVVLYGKIGAGKSTFLRALLGDALQLNRRGVIEVKGRVAYCSQDPWLQTLSIRENILFGQPYDEHKYLNVLQACCLVRDLATFPSGDQTIVGPKGLNISGGQKARICLARACYADADVYVLDSPLSSVDSIIQSDIFTRCIVELLKNKTVVLVTHNMEIVTSPFADQVVRLEDHHFIHETSLGSSFSTHPQLDYRPRRSVRVKRMPGSRYTNSERKQEDETTPTPPTSDAQSTTGLELTNYKGSRVEAKWLAIATRVDGNATTTSEIDAELDADTASGYVSLCGSLWFLVPLALAVTLARASLVASDIWVCLWSQQVSRLEKYNTATAVQTTNEQRQTKVAVYAMLILSAAAMTFYGSVVTTTGCKDAANKLFSRMIRGVLYSPMSFFYARPIGEILNRFSGDVVRMDNYLQEIIFKNASSLAGVVIPCIVLMAMIPEMIFVLPVLAYVVHRNRFHLKVALEMTRLSVASLSPCYNSIEEYVEGCRVIQAFGWSQVDRFRRLHQQHLDTMLKMRYADAMFQSWSALRFMKMDMLLIGVLIVCPFRRDMNPVVLGLALNYIFLMNSQLYSWYSSALELGSSLLCVKRVVEYAELPTENSLAKGAPQNVPNAWPIRGEIVFDKASFQYSKLGGPVIKSVTLRILPGEKVGLVGRTGAGKSSLTLALFRIHELVSGRIFIDGIDISFIDVYSLRSRLSIIPQSPLFFQGSVRSYLDPFDDVEDADLWDALRKTGLADAVARMDGKLSAQLHENAENLSQGERQLLCLSRVLLKQSKIVVLDEATVAIDHLSDEKLQGVLQTEFVGATVISIAHRLESILEFDRVVVMDDGRVVQCGTVEELVSDANGPFFDLLEGALLKM